MVSQALAFALSLFLLIGLALVYQLWIFGHVVYWNFYNPSTSAFMEERLEILRQKNPAATLHIAMGAV